MDPHSNYRQTYDNPRLDDAYRQFVDGFATLRQLVNISGVSIRTLERRSSRDDWKDEREEKKSNAAAAASVLNQLAAVTQDGPITADGLGVKDIMVGVLRRQQKFWDRVEAEVIAYFDQIQRAAEEKDEAIAIGRLNILLKAAETASANVRKAYGIPDVTRVEIDDRSTAAGKHVIAIKRRREARMLELAKRDAPTTTETETTN
jgi:hypothetical protein